MSIQEFLQQPFGIFGLLRFAPEENHLSKDVKATEPKRLTHRYVNNRRYRVAIKFHAVKSYEPNKDGVCRRLPSLSLVLIRLNSRIIDRTRNTASPVRTPGVDMSPSENVVEWTLSGSYDTDKPVLIDASDPSRFISRRKATDLVASLSGAFESDSTVCLHIPNDILYPIILLAILASRCRWTGTNIAYTQHELVHHFRVSDTKYVITLPEYQKTVEAAIHGLGSVIEIILFTDILRELPKPGAANKHQLRPGTELAPASHSSADEMALRTLHDLLSAPDIGRLEKHLKALAADDVAALQSTSGTTGLPKMAARTHKALILETDAIEDNNAEKPYEVRRLFCTPIFHAFSTPEMVINPLRLGYPTYFMRRFDNTFAEKVHQFGITETAAPPPMLMRLQQQAESHRLLQSLRLIFCGGAPLAPEIRRRALESFKEPPRIVQVWGMTEGGWFSTFKYPEDDSTGSVGKIVPGYEIKMSLEDSVEMADGRLAGQLLVKGQQLMTGYRGNIQASEEAFTDGWLKTGDVGYIEDGKVYLVDRAKDLIKVNGWQVAPAEIEAALLQSPDVQDAAAIGVGHGVEEHPMVFVVARHEHVNASDVETHLRSRLARHKVAQVEVEFVDSIPRNPSGKVLRNVLREQMLEKRLYGR